MNVQEAYNIWSEIYDTNKNFTRDLDEKATKSVLSEIKFKNVLEIGCGTGKNTLRFEKKAEFVCAVDFSEKMLEIAKQKIKSEKVKFYKADITENWNFTNEKFDLISINLVLEHIENLDFIFKQAYEKLETNGFLFVSELHPFKQYLGSKARFEMNNQTNELKVFTHNISDFWKVAQKNNFKCLKINEWKTEDEENEVPRLISFLFKKKN